MVISGVYFSGDFKQNQDHSSGHVDLHSVMDPIDPNAVSYIPSQNEINRLFLRMDMSEGLSTLGRNIVAHYQRVVDPDLTGFYAPLSIADVVRMCEGIVNSPTCQEVPLEDRIVCDQIAEDENRFREGALGVKEGASDLWTNTVNMISGLWNWLFGTDMQTKKTQIQEAIQPFANTNKENYKKWLERRSNQAVYYPDLVVAITATGETVGDFGYLIGHSIKEAMVGAIDRFPCLNYRQKWASLTQFSGEMGAEVAIEVATLGMIGPILVARRGLVFMHKSSKHFEEFPRVQSASSQLNAGESLEMIPENDIPALDNPRIQIERGRGSFDEGFWVSDNSLIAMNHQLDQVKADFYLAMIRDNQWNEGRATLTSITTQQEAIKELFLENELLEKYQNILLETTETDDERILSLLEGRVKNTPLSQLQFYLGRIRDNRFGKHPSKSAERIRGLIQQRNHLKSLFENGPLAEVIDESLRKKIINNEYIDDQFIIDSYDVTSNSSSRDRPITTRVIENIRIKNNNDPLYYGPLQLHQVIKKLDSQNYYAEVNEAVERIDADHLRRMFEDEDRTLVNELTKFIDNDMIKFDALKEKSLRASINVGEILSDLRKIIKNERSTIDVENENVLSIDVKWLLRGNYNNFDSPSSILEATTLEDLILSTKQIKPLGYTEAYHKGGGLYTDSQFLENGYLRLIGEDQDLLAEAITESMKNAVYSNIIKEYLQMTLNRIHIVSEIHRHDMFINGFGIEKDILKESQELTSQLASRYDELIGTTKVMDLNNEDIRNLHTTIQNLETSINERLGFIEGQDGILEITQ